MMMQTVISCMLLIISLQTDMMQDSVKSGKQKGGWSQEKKESVIRVFESREGYEAKVGLIFEGDLKAYGKFIGGWELSGEGKRCRDPKFLKETKTEICYICADSTVTCIPRSLQEFMKQYFR